MISESRKDKFRTANRKEYGEEYAGLHFPDEAERAFAMRYRSALLEELGKSVITGCHGTKLDMRGLSPGCRICTEGAWSCLFISGKCNCSCFYCPTSQDEIGQPTTNTVEFPQAQEYVAYLKQFGFRGASISGGEPLLTAERSLAFVKAIKNRFGNGMHVWLYTNGTLATPAILAKLRDAGLDEIRFDIGAVGYSLKPLQQAVGVIPIVTVEIPAVPEEKERLKEIMSTMWDAGVQHLNLHQLRLTPYNVKHLRSRGYRFLHGEKVTVLDSELTALELMLHGMQQGIKLPVNYCSFVYKNRFQARAARQRNGLWLMKEHEAMSENGFIRTLTVTGSVEQLQGIANILPPAGKGTVWSLNKAGEKLNIHPSLFFHIPAGETGLLLAHSAVYQRPSLSYRNPFHSVQLTAGKTVHLEREKHHADIELNSDQAQLFARVFLYRTEQIHTLPNEEPWRDLLVFEHPKEGLQEYF